MQESKQYNSDLLPSNGKFFRKDFTDSAGFSNETRGIFFHCSKSFISFLVLGEYENNSRGWKLPASSIDKKNHVAILKKLCTSYKTNIKHTCKDSSTYSRRSSLQHLNHTGLDNFTKTPSRLKNQTGEHTHP